MRERRGELSLVVPAGVYDRLCREALRQRTTVTALAQMAVEGAPVFPSEGPRVNMHMRFPVDLAEAVRGKARASGMTQTAYVRQAVRLWLAGRGR